MKLPSRIRFLDPKTEAAFHRLERGDESERRLFRWLNDAFDSLEDNAFCGIQIPKRLIPAAYRKQYGIHNLWKYDLPQGWRLLYSVVANEVAVVSLILEWADHKSYERKLGY